MCCVGTNISVKQVYCVYINHVVDLFSLQGCRPRPLLLCKVYFRDKKSYICANKYPHKCPSRITKHCVNAVSEVKVIFLPMLVEKYASATSFIWLVQRSFFALAVIWVPPVLAKNCTFYKCIGLSFLCIGIEKISKARIICDILQTLQL